LLVAPVVVSVLAYEVLSDPLTKPRPPERPAEQASQLSG